MSKGATAVSVIALLVGVTAIGFGYFGVYDTIRPKTVDPLTSYILLSELLDPPTNVLDTWYTSYEGTRVTSGTIFISEITTTISITGIQNVNLYLCFMSEIVVTGGSNPYYLRFYVDGSPVGFTRIGMNHNWTSVSLQTVVEGVEPGTHTIQVQLSISGGSSVRVGYVGVGYGITLFIQSYI